MLIQFSTAYLAPVKAAISQVANALGARIDRRIGAGQARNRWRTEDVNTAGCARSVIGDLWFMAAKVNVPFTFSG